MKKPYQTHSMKLLASWYQNQVTDITENHIMIYLVIINAKKLNKILANQIQKHFMRIIHYDQVGFTLERQVLLNICKSTNVTQHINKCKD